MIGEPGSKINAKTIDKENAQKKEFLAQQIRLCIKDKHGNVVPGCEFTVTRKYFMDTTALVFINVLISKSPLPDTEVDFYIDQDENVLFKEDMLLKAAPLPSYYTIIPCLRRMPEDILKNPCYSGV